MERRVHFKESNNNKDFKWFVFIITEVGNKRRLAFQRRYTGGWQAREKMWTSLVVQEIQTKVTVGDYFTPTRMTVIFNKWKIKSVGEGVEKLEPSYIAGGNTKWHSCCGRPSGCSSKNYTQNYHMTYQCHPRYKPKRIEDRCSNKYLYKNVIAALFTVARVWKCPEYPLTDEWINKIW